MRRFTSEQAREAGRKGGATRAKDNQAMREMSRLGVEAKRRKRDAGKVLSR